MYRLVKNRRKINNTEKKTTKNLRKVKALLEGDRKEFFFPKCQYVFINPHIYIFV